MGVKTAILQKVVALPIRELPVDREGGIVGALRVGEFGSLAVVRARKVTNQSITQDIETDITFTAEDIDTAGMHDNAVNPERFTAPIAGIYRISATLSFVANTVGHRQLLWGVNGTARLLLGAVPATDAEQTVVHGSTLLRLAENDFVVFAGEQGSAAGLAVEGASRSFASMEYLGE